MTLELKEEHLKAYPAIAPELFKDEIKGKTVLITGGGYGLGSVLANSFALASASHVILVGRTLSRLETTATTLRKAHPATKFTPLASDVTSVSSVSALFASLTSPVDILINNAGYLSTPTNILTANLDDFWQNFTINVWGLAVFTQHFLKHYLATTNATLETPPATPAVVVNVNTIAAHEILMPNFSPYGASKAAAARLNELWQMDIPSSTARFVGLHPGILDTEMGRKAGLVGVLPVSEMDLPANMAVWLCTEEAKWLAGRMVFAGWDVQKLREMRGVAEKEGEGIGGKLLRAKLVGAELGMSEM